MLPIDSGDLRGIMRGSFHKSVYEKSTQPGAKFILKLTVTEGIIKKRKTAVVFIEKATGIIQKQRIWDYLKRFRKSSELPFFELEKIKLESTLKSWGCQACQYRKLFRKQHLTETWR